MTSTARTKRNLPIIKRLNVFVRHVLFVTARRYQLFVGEAETICHSAPPFTLSPVCLLEKRHHLLLSLARVAVLMEGQ